MTGKTAKQPRSVTSNAEDRKAEICLIAARLMREKGFEATSMNDIAEAANITKAGLYYYTAGKHDLLYRIMDYAMTLVEQNVIIPCSEIAEPLERLTQIVRRHVRMTADGREAVTILTEEVNSLPAPQRRQIIERKRVYLDLVRSTLEELSRQKLLRDIDPTLGALNLFATILGIARWHRRDGRLSTEEVVDDVSTFILGGLLRGN